MRFFMNVAIVDDLTKQLESLSKQIEQTWRQRDKSGTFAAFSNVMDLYPVVSQYDVVFIDIKMPDKDGITAAKELAEIASDLIIVFVSDYDSYVWESFQADPVYFLRKAYLREELPRVVEKCIYTYAKRNQDIIIEGSHETFRCKVRELYYIEAQGKFISLHFAQDEKRIRTAFSKVEKQLEKQTFLKVHRSYLVNGIHIRSFQNKQVILENGEVLPVSKYRYETIRQQYLMSLT